MDDRSVSAIYDATGLLLILGEPGSGKTTTLLDLAHTLLDRAANDIKERVAVVLNLSTWKKKQPLAEWMAGELSEKYRIPRKIALFWVEHDYLLPLLDGLDEVEVSMRPDCVAAINAFIADSNASGLVVCCRLLEYQWLLPERLKLNGAICLEPLSSEEVSKYLSEGGAEMAALRDAVDSDPVLQELAQTPLMLSIMILAYQGADGTELARLAGNSPEERRKHIFHLYIEQMFKRKGTPTFVFPKEKVIGWLTWLAGKMREHSQSVFLVEGLQPSWLGKMAKRLAYGSLVALSLGLVFALSSGIGYGQFSGIGQLVYGLSGWALGLIFGLIFGLSIFLGVGLGCWLRSPLKNSVVSGSIVGLTLGLSYGAIYGVGYGIPTGKALGWDVGIRYGVQSGLGYGLSWGLVGSLTGGVIGALGVGSLTHITSVETINWKWNRFWKAAISSSVFGVIGGIIAGFSLSVGKFLDERAAAGTFGWPGAWLEEMAQGQVFGGVLGQILGALRFFWPEFGLRYTLLGGVLGLLVGSFIGGFADAVKPDKASPNKGIKLSGKNSLAVFLFTCLTVGVTGGLGVWLRTGLGVWLSIGLIVALIAGLNRGGSAVIKHYALRLILCVNGDTPLNFVKFLDECAKLILLKKVGGGYIFIHRMLLDYFAEMTPQNTRAGDATIRSVGP